MDPREWKLITDLIRNSAPTRVVLLKSDDAKKMQSHQARGLSGELFEEVEYFQPYGFTSRPLAGSEAVAFPVGGDRGHLIVLASSDRGVRKKGMKEGEVGLYTAEGDFIYFKNGNKIETQTKESTTNAEDKAVTNTKEFEANASQTAAVTAGEQATVTAPQIGLAGNLTVTDKDGGSGVTRFRGDVYIIGDLYVDGDIQATGDIVAGSVSLRKHLHRDTMPGDGRSGPPVGGDS